jgi:hypothetical protein
VIVIAQRHGSKRGALDDLAVVLHRDRARIHAELFEVREQRRGMIELDALPVDLERDQLKSPMAA